jgi:pimeloyl-ACP methyl ester carboxylesterase
MKNLRIYGNRPYSVAVLHGGPGYPGAMAPVARELSTDYGVLEPLQDADSIDGQVKELESVLRKNADLPVILVGWSWGSTLALITAAQHPNLVRKLILVCGAPLEKKYRENVFAEKLNRLSDDERAEVFSLQEIAYGDSPGDKAASLARLFEIFSKADSFDLLPHTDEVIEYQVDINKSVGIESHKLYTGNDLLKVLAGIRCSVIAINGDSDTRPAAGISEPLSRILKDFRYILLEKCGHMPWYERYARDRFYKILRKEIKHGLTGD